MGFSRQGVGCHFLLQGIFPAQGLSLGLLHCRQILYHLSHHCLLSGLLIMQALSCLRTLKHARPSAWKTFSFLYSWLFFNQANYLIKISPYTSLPSLTTISKYAPSSFFTTALLFSSFTYHNLKLPIYCLFNNCLFSPHCALTS